MQSLSLGLNLARFSRWRRRRRVQTLSTLGLVLLGPVLVILTFAALGPLDQGRSTVFLQAVLLLDLTYVLVIAALVMQRVAQMIAARRAKSAGSRLHLRLTGVFAFLALLPTVLVAVFAVFTVNAGLEGWFSDRVREVIGASQAAAQAYKQEQRDNLAEDALAMARVLNGERTAARLTSDSLFDGNVRQILSRIQPRVQRGIAEAFVIDSAGVIRSRGASSYQFDYDQPKATEIGLALDEGLLIIEDWPANEFRVLVPLTAFTDRFLFISREVDGEILTLLDETEESAQLYNQLESDRGSLLYQFGLLYLGFATILILAATWLGLWFAERLARPVGRLAGAAQRVGAGDLNVRVPEEEGDDEIAMLGRYFNQMTKQLRGQRDTLLENTEQIERRRRLFDSVLSSVTSGVIGVNVEGEVTFVNRSAERLLMLKNWQEHTQLTTLVPEFDALWAGLGGHRREVVQEEINITRGGKLETLLVRLAVRRGEGGNREGYVVAFEDVSDLVTAQRMAAWGDVARRIAHEIKNPLTPIQLSAERIKRKFSPKLGEESDVLDQMTDVIVRQTTDLRRIVDEFSKFARMPEPKRAPENLMSLLRDAILLQEAGQPNVRFVSDLEEVEAMANVDSTMITQALTNLMKNAGEAIESLKETGERVDAEIRVSGRTDKGDVVVRIADNGIGLPEDRNKLFEPYVTSRDSGTGLGLPIVLKIIEEHEGTLTLDDAEPFEGTGRKGACAEIRLPLITGDHSKPTELQIQEAV